MEKSRGTYDLKWTLVVILGAVLLGNSLQMAIGLAIFWGGYQVGFHYTGDPRRAALLGCGIIIGASISLLLHKALRGRSQPGTLQAKLVRRGRTLIRSWDQNRLARFLSTTSSVLGLLRAFSETMTGNTAEGTGHKVFIVQWVAKMPPAVGIFLIAVPIFAELVAHALRSQFARDAEMIMVRTELLGKTLATYEKAKIHILDDGSQLEWKGNERVRMILGTVEATVRAFIGSARDDVSVTLWKVENDQVVERSMTIPVGEQYLTSLDTINNPRSGVSRAIQSKKAQVVRDIQRPELSGTTFVQQPGASPRTGCALSVPIRRGVEENGTVVGVLCVWCGRPEALNELSVVDYERWIGFYCSEIMHAGLTSSMNGSETAKEIR